MNQAHIRSPYQARVDEFMRKAGQCVPATPFVPDAEVRRLRASLILEEAFETVRALGFEPSTTLDELTGKSSVVLTDVYTTDLIEVVDGCCDIVVVTLGTLSAFGVSDFGPMKEVLDSNDSKFVDGYLRDDGKWMKGPSYKPADLARVIDAQRV